MAKLNEIVGEEKYLADKVESFIKKEFLADNLDGVIAVNGAAEIKDMCSCEGRSPSPSLADNR